MSARQQDARPARGRRRRGIGAAASLVVLAAAVGACSSNVGGGQESVARPGNAKGKGIITGSPGAQFPPSFSSSSPAPSSSSAAGSTGRATTISAGSVGRLGVALRDGQGRPVYLFTKDRDQHSTCYGSCAQVWLPVTAGGTPHATGRAKSSLLGTTTRHDGQKQVTYAGHPLYYHGSRERQSSGAKGEGLSQFGGAWYAVSPRGTAVHKPGP